MFYLEILKLHLSQTDQLFRMGIEYSAIVQPSDALFLFDMNDIVFSFFLLSFNIQVLPLENQMKKPNDFTWIINLGMIFVTVVYVCMGLFGYMMCKDNCQGSITLSLGNDA